MPCPDGWGTVGPRDWDRGTVLVIGAGPSLAGVNLPALLADRPGLRAAVTVKAMGWALPAADACICADHRWTARALPWDRPRPPLYLAVDDDWSGYRPPGTVRLRRWPCTYLGALSPHPGALAFGRTSGFAALNYAVLRGARRILLLGFDYRHDAAGQHHAAPALNHWYRPAEARFWPDWTAPFAAAAPALHGLGVVVGNATPGSALTAFPGVELDAELPHH